MPAAIEEPADERLKVSPFRSIKMSISSARIALAACFVGQVRDASEVIKGGYDTLSCIAAVLRARAITEHFEPATVVALKQLGDQQAHRMLAEIRRNIAEPDSVMAVSCRWTEPLDLGSSLPLDPDIVDLPLLRDVVEQSKRA